MDDNVKALGRINRAFLSLNRGIIVLVRTFQIDLLELPHKYTLGHSKFPHIAFYLLLKKTLYVELEDQDFVYRQSFETDLTDSRISCLPVSYRGCKRQKQILELLVETS